MSKLTEAQALATTITNETVQNANDEARVGGTLTKLCEAIAEEGGLKVTANAGITGATKTKITYDAKGLVTAGADATTADIADSTNKRYCTDAEKTNIGTITSKQDKLTTQVTPDYWQEASPVTIVENKLWYKPSTAELFLMVAGDWLGATPNNAAVYVDINTTSRYIWTGSDMLALSVIPTHDMPFYTERTDLSGTFTLSRNEVLSFPNALTGALTINLEVPLSNRPNIYTLCANMGGTLQTLTLACTGYTFTWAGGSAPTITISKPFEISFVKVAPTIINAIFKQF